MALNIVITMAGRGSRFVAVGYKVPKYEIVAHGKSLFDWAILSLRNFLSGDVRVTFVCLKENNSREYVHGRCEALGINDVRIVEVDEVTDGQATSAYMSKGSWLKGQSLLIYNIDTYVKPIALKPSDIKPGSDGWVPCFCVPGDHWSFVRLDEDGWAVDLAEKQRISEFASIGLYWFSCESKFRYAYEATFSQQQNLVRGEKYIAPMYKTLIEQGAKVSISNLPVEDVYVLGTPLELDQFLETDGARIIDGV